MNIKQVVQIGPVSLFYLVFNGCELHLRETKIIIIGIITIWVEIIMNICLHILTSSKICDLMRDTPFYETLASENSEGTANAFWYIEDLHYWQTQDKAERSKFQIVSQTKIKFFHYFLSTFFPFNSNFSSDPWFWNWASNWRSQRERK